MKKIFRVADNPFDDREISTERLATFAADAHPKLAADFPAEAAALKTATDTVVACMGNVRNLDAGRTTDTSDLDRFLAETATFMRQSMARVSVDLGEDSDAYAAIYPDGIQTYTRLSKGAAPSVFKALKETMAGAGAALHAPTRERMAGLYQQWLGLRGAQDNTEGELEEERDARDDGRTGLEWALFDALLAAARRFQKEPDALKRYFNHTLLDAPRHASRERQAEAPAS